jgi:hypothetical protein
MDNQLVVQFEASTSDHFARLIHFEETLNERVGQSAIVDGHDFGSGELNIFVLTDDPMATFDLVQEVAEELRLQQQMRVAFRKARVEDENYVILWPPSLKEFQIK